MIKKKKTIRAVQLAMSKNSSDLQRKINHIVNKKDVTEFDKILLAGFREQKKLIDQQRRTLSAAIKNG